MSKMTSFIPYTLLLSSALTILKLSLGLNGRQHELLHLLCSFIDVVAHTFRSQLLGHNVELQAVLVDHVGDTPALVNDLAPTVAVEVFG